LAIDNRIEAIDDEPFSDGATRDEAGILACRSDLFAWCGLSPQGRGSRQDDYGARDMHRQETPPRLPHPFLQIFCMVRDWFKRSCRYNLANCAARQSQKISGDQFVLLRG
jgi:hypothetical protein